MKASDKTKDSIDKSYNMAMRGYPTVKKGDSI